MLGKALISYMRNRFIEFDLLLLRFQTLQRIDTELVSALPSYI